MNAWRQIKAKARAQVHGLFQVDGVYLTHFGGTPVRVSVRLHTKFANAENEFTWPATGGFLTKTPKIIFLASEVQIPRPKAMLIVSPTEMYRIGASEPPHEGFTTAVCDQMSGQECLSTLTAIGNVSNNPAWTGIL